MIIVIVLIGLFVIGYFWWLINKYKTKHVIFHVGKVECRELNYYDDLYVCSECGRTFNFGSNESVIKLFKKEAICEKSNKKFTWRERIFGFVNCLGSEKRRDDRRMIFEVERREGRCIDLKIKKLIVHGVEVEPVYDEEGLMQCEVEFG